MPNHVESDITVQRFGYTGDAQGKRLTFPRAESHAVEGRSGSVSYGAADLILDTLEGRLDTTRLRGRRGLFRGTLRYRAQRFGTRDVLVYCVSGLVRQGIGVGDALDRRCGARRIPYKPAPAE